MCFERTIHSLRADFAPRKLLFVRHYTMPCAHQSKRRACVRVKRLRMRDEDLSAICDRTKKKKEAGILTRAFPLESPSKNYAFLGILERQIVFQAGNRLVQLGANRSLLV